MSTSIYQPHVMPRKGTPLWDLASSGRRSRPRKAGDGVFSRTSLVQVSHQQPPLLPHHDIHVHSIWHGKKPSFDSIADHRVTPPMMQSHSARKALQCLPRARQCSLRSSPLQSYSPALVRNVSDTAKRPAQAAAAPASQRAVPSPAFNRDESRYRDVQPLQPFRQPEMDHSFVGMKGGEIFHEMMLRQGVKHVCKW